LESRPLRKDPLMTPIRSLPRVFVPGANSAGEFELPNEEVDKLRKVLRLSSGAELAVLPNDGTIIRCELKGHSAVPKEVYFPNTESSRRLEIAQALPKGDKIDEIIRSCTEIGVAHFILFPSDRTVVRWDEKKTADRVRRLQIIAREAAEVSYRTILPTFEVQPDLASVLRKRPDASVLSEVEGLNRGLRSGEPPETIVVGPEGGWSSAEIALIGDRGLTLGPRVLRVDHAAAAAAAILLLA
jgi:16S rRNA (uracil1498-N3)-methyltransferase